MLQKILIALVIIAVCLSLISDGIIGATLALLAFLLVLYYSLSDINKSGN